MKGKTRLCLALALMISCSCLASCGGAANTETGSWSEYGDSNATETTTYEVVQTESYASYEAKAEGVVVDVPVTDAAIGATVTVTLAVYIEGLGYKDCGYSSLRFKTVENETIDDALPTETWNEITCQTKVLFNGTNRFVRVRVENGSGETFRVSDDTVISTEFFDDVLLGGTELYQLPSIEMEQNCSYVFVTKEGSLIVYDGGNDGDADYLLDFLYGFKSEVDAWFLSHYHNDHIGALSSILESDGITVNNLYMDFPDEATIKKHDGSTGTDYKRLMSNLDKVKNVVSVQKDDKITVDEVTVTVLNDCLEYSNNYGNNTTVVYRVDTLGESVLLLGDAGIEVGEWLVKNNPEGISDCALVQAAHHGQNGTNKAFYEFIDSKIWLVPAPDWLWYGRGDDYKFFTYGGISMKETREWIRDLRVVKKYVSKDGLTKIV